MGEVIFGKPGLFLVGNIGSEAKNERPVVTSTYEWAEKEALQRVTRHDWYVIYKLVEVAIVMLGPPTVKPYEAETAEQPK